MMLTPTEIEQAEREAQTCEAAAALVKGGKMERSMLLQARSIRLAISYAKADLSNIHNIIEFANRVQADAERVIKGETE